jgi:hypothetical protein
MTVTEHHIKRLHKNKTWKDGHTLDRLHNGTFEMPPHLQTSVRQQHLEWENNANERGEREMNQHDLSKHLRT